jgi:YegS/Rv2252/BmrU family lipid kinase
VLPAGTGNDFGKSFGVTWKERESAVRAMARGLSRQVDVGRVEGRHFLNVFGCGFDVACIDDASRFTRLRGELLYKYCALRQLFRYRGKPLNISVDGTQESVGPSLLVVISNARYFGGSFDIAPWADLSDGKLDMVAVGDAGPLQRARLFQTVSAGRHTDGGLITIRSAPSFTLEFEPPMRYELDGEVYGTNEARIQVESVPAALRVFSPQGEPRD